MSFSGIRGLVYTLFATVMLSTLWVTSLGVLSSPGNATALLADAGADVLNPFLVAHGTGITQAYYAALQATAASHPSQGLSIPFIKVAVPGKDIVGKSYADGTHAIYSDVAGAYYTEGAGAVFALPPELQQVLPDFALFNPNNIPLIPGGPTVSQLPNFLQPLFIFVGLTPDTFTLNGHQRLLGLLGYFWLATGVLGALALLLNPSGKKIAGLAQGVIHSAWPIVAVLVGLWIASAYYAALAPYRGALAVIRGAFLPIYGAALVVGILGIALTAWLPRLLQRQQASARVPAGVGAGLPPGLMEQMGQMGGMAPTSPMRRPMGAEAPAAPEPPGESPPGGGMGA